MIYSVPKQIVAGGATIYSITGAAADNLNSGFFDALRSIEGCVAIFAGLAAGIYHIAGFVIRRREIREKPPQPPKENAPGP